jgi:hypothetical protein
VNLSLILAAKNALKPASFIADELVAGQSLMEGLKGVLCLADSEARRSRRFKANEIPSILFELGWYLGCIGS